MTLGYDPLGRLASSTGGPQPTRFLYDGDALVAEYSFGGTLLRRYAHWVGADVPLLWYEISELNSPYYLQADQQGSIILVTDRAGNPSVNRYDEYGIPQSTKTSRFAYTGQIRLPEIGMYYYKARIYSPTLGRFLQRDPVGYEGGNNFYAYVGDDPVNDADSSGQCGLRSFRYGCKIDYGPQTRAPSPDSTTNWGLQRHLTSGRGRTVYYDPAAWGLGQHDDHGETIWRAATGRLNNPNSRVLAQIRDSAEHGGRAVPISFSTTATAYNMIGNYTIHWTGTVEAYAGRYEINVHGTVAPQRLDWNPDTYGRDAVRDSGVSTVNRLGLGGGQSYVLLPTRSINGTFTGSYQFDR